LPGTPPDKGALIAPARKAHLSACNRISVLLALLSIKSLEFNSVVAGTSRATKGPIMDHSEKRSVEGGVLPDALALVREALGRLRYGAIQLTVHDGKVMQIDITERKRLTD
jgi:hypothetical protein